MRFFFKIRPFFIRYKLNMFFNFFEKYFFLFSYYNYYSRWINNNNKNILFNDFYNHFPNLKEKFNLHNFIINQFNLRQEEIEYYEFGVYQGESIKFWLNNNVNPYSRFVGFDVFTGLPETWSNIPKGYFSTHGQIPIVNDNRCSFISGMFQNTVFEFIKNKEFSKQCIFHFDADLYSSTLYTLITIYPKMKKNDILIFDEFSIMLHEFRALVNFIEATKIELKLIGAINNYNQVALQIVNRYK